MSINTLPQELISLIMDYLSDDRESLKAASLISPIFLPTCQNHLFKRLCMSSFNPVFDYQCSAWADILRRSSDVLQYVKILEIGPPLLRSRSRSFWSTRLLGDTPSEDTLHPSINDPRLESILAGIIHPQSVTLRFQHSQWRNISLSLQKVISRLISQELLTTLSLEDVNDFPLEVLQDCRNLLHLSLIAVRPLHPEIIVENGPSSNTGFLDTLTLMSTDQCIEALIATLSASRSRLCLSRLRTISINIGLENGPDILQKISRAASTITSITLRFIDHISNTGLSPNTTHAWEAYDLCHPKAFSNLRSLVISASYSRHSRPIRALASFLSTFGPQSTLEALTLHFRTDVPRLRFQSRTHADSLERMCSHADWRLVEAQCMGAGRFPSLRKVTLAFRPKDVVGMDMSPYLDQTLPLCLMNVMPNLYALMSSTIALLEDPFEGYQYEPAP
ncbi:hypothetical protein BJ912DRAFT_1064119 [Pholiota molesta]|nr:hypothetical protein BJ912DRAFT_1064119 [Pholiota molesta]